MLYTFIVTKRSHETDKIISLNFISIAATDISKARTKVRAKHPHSKGYFTELYSKQPNQ